MRNFDKFFPGDSRRAQALIARSLFPEPQPPEDDEPETEPAE